MFIELLAVIIVITIIIKLEKALFRQITREILDTIKLDRLIIVLLLKWDLG